MKRPALLGLSLTACGTETPEPETSGMPLHVANTSVLKTGEQVYRETCMICHATGVADAPKVGDDDDWDSLIEEGQARVTAHGWVGMGAMPPRGGDPIWVWRNSPARSRGWRAAPGRIGGIPMTTCSTRFARRKQSGSRT